jgi:hypothetical protein
MQVATYKAVVRFTRWYFANNAHPEVCIRCTRWRLHARRRRLGWLSSRSTMHLQRDGSCAHSYSSPQSGLRPDTLEFCCDIPLSELLLLCILLNLQASGTATMLQSSVTYQAASSSLAESAACLASMGPSALV